MKEMSKQERDFKIAQRGRLGEEYVRNYLVSNGYTIVTSNYSCRYGEIDIIAKDKDFIVFVEVKTRTRHSMTGGFESITKKKRLKILRAVEIYLINENSELQPRIDCAQVIVSEYDNSLIEISYIENAIEGESYYALF